MNFDFNKNKEYKEFRMFSLHHKKDYKNKEYKKMMKIALNDPYLET